MATKPRAAVKPAVKKAAPVKKTAKPLEIQVPLPFLKSIAVDIIDWKSMPSGTPFKALRHGKLFEGKILVIPGDSMVYFCQNKVSGASGYTRLGYNYSHGVNINTNNTLDLLKINYDITNIKFYPVPADFVLPVKLPQMAGYNPIINKGNVSFGCKTIPNADIRLLAKNLID